MSHLSSWSNDSQTMTRICVLESQVEVKGNRIGILETENLLLKKENDRLSELIKKLLEKEK